MGADRPASQPWARIAFGLSGCASLIYQVVWQRLLVLFTGVDVYAVTIVVAAFLTGLGVGALFGGRLADRIGPRGSLWAFAAAELLIAGFGLMSKLLYYDALSIRFAFLSATPPVMAVVVFGSLLVPTALMGMSLPLLARALARDGDGIGSVVGSLYGWNTIGAAGGAFIGTWVLLPRIGLERSLWVAALLNIACVAVALLGMRTVASTPPVTAHAPPGETVSDSRPCDQLSLRTALLVSGLTGFIALGLEIVWFRLIGVMLKSTAFTFGTLLTVYLSGLGLGAAAAARWVAGSRRPAITFLVLQYGVTLYAAFSTIALMALLEGGHPSMLVAYLGEYEPMGAAAAIASLRDLSSGAPAVLTPLFHLVMVQVVLPLVLIGPATVMMGASFPFLQRAAQSDFPRVGARVGALLAANIAGGVAGAALVGWVLLSTVGTAGSLKTVTGLGVCLTITLVHLLWRQRPRAAAAVVTLAVMSTGIAIGLLPDNDALWARLHTAAPGRVLSAESAAGVSVLKSAENDWKGDVGVYVNGLGQSWIPYGRIHTALGALPAIIHPAPNDVLVIGLGSGDTAFAAAGRRETQRLVLVEIVEAQLETLRRLIRRRPDPGAMALLSDRRVEHRAGDGRAYLTRTRQLFDVIEADALRPNSAYAGNLYSREFFVLAQQRLKPGGVAVTWVPTERTGRTFVSVFPYVLAFGDIYLGSASPIPFDAEQLAARAASVRPYYEAAGIDILAVLRPYLRSRPRFFSPEHPRPLSDLNTDTFPRDEFSLPF